MGWAEELNNSETLLKVIDRLPQYFQIQWAERAESILKLGKRPRFSDLTKFVQDKADVANNMFSKHINESRKKNSKDKPRTTMYEVSTRGSTLATKGDIHKNQGNRSSLGTTTRPQCLLCRRWHELGDCE